MTRLGSNTVSDSPDAPFHHRRAAFSDTALGPFDHWPSPLQAALDACLGSSFPAFVWWGPQLIQLYNEASKPLLHRRHPAAMGRPAHESWTHAWPVIKPVVDRVFETGNAAVARAVAVMADGNDGAPSSHFDFYYNAILGEQGDIAGLYVVTTENIERTKHGTLHEKMLDAAVRLTGSDFASLQLLDPEREELRLIAHRGFPADAAAFWDRVRVESGTTCGKALERHRRVVVADVEQADFIRGTIDLRVFLDAGIRAVQTTPLVSRDQQLIGMMSTHWRRTYLPQLVELERFDLLARHVADVFERTGYPA
jgi:hypothetical protein